MLKQSYEDWRRFALRLLQQDQYIYDEWLSVLSKNRPEYNIQLVSADYTRCLRRLKDKGLMVSPGRFVLPAELEGTPILEFFPLTDELLGLEDNNIQQLNQQMEQRYYQFKDEVIAPFFERYFQSIDRQILLVDCLNLLKNKGKDAQLMAEAIEELSNIFCYGDSRFWNRLWRPKIDRVLFAATKADQIPTDQQYRLQSLIESLFYPTHNKLKFRETKVAFLTLAAVKCTEPVVAEVEGKSLHCIKGILRENDEPMVIFPGTLPENLTEIEGHEYDLPEYRPPILKSEAIPHIRMGKVLEFLTGDLLR
jgi:hypothetical protein